MQDIVYYNETYEVPGYVLTGYIDNPINNTGFSIQFRYSTISEIGFVVGCKYTSETLKFFQATDVTVSKFPFYSASKLSQAEFEVTFPYMTDSELNNLRTFMYTTLPLFETFDFVVSGKGYYFSAKFKNRKIKVSQLLNNINEVTLNIVRI